MLAQHVQGFEDMKMVTMAVNPIINDMYRVSGYSPALRVFGPHLRYTHIGSQYDEDEWNLTGAISAEVDVDEQVHQEQRYRQSAKVAFTQEDCSRRVKRALLRNTPTHGNRTYKPGDFVSFRRNDGKYDDDYHWSSACRVIGPDGDENYWVMCEGVPILVARDMMRPIDTSEA